MKLVAPGGFQGDGKKREFQMAEQNLAQPRSGGGR